MGLPAEDLEAGGPTYWPETMALHGRERRPCWPPNTAVCSLISTKIITN